MKRATTRTPDLPGFPFHQFRLLRFRNGVYCPRCGARRVHRWGSYRQRQRYRCLSCRRTFSDLTGTPLAYMKRIDLWGAYVGLAAETATIRCAARRLGIHPSTSFRWRHRLLHSALERESVELRDVISIDMSFIAHSEKGSRSLHRPARHVAFEGWSWQGRVAWIVVACDSGGEAIAAHLPARPHADDVVPTLVNHLDPRATLVNGSGWYGVVAQTAVRLGMCAEREPPADVGGDVPGDRMTPARLYALRWKRWMRRFMGVASRYLDHYLLWYRLLHRMSTS